MWTRYQATRVLDTDRVVARKLDAGGNDLEVHSTCEKEKSSSSNN